MTLSDLELEFIAHIEKWRGATERQNQIADMRKMMNPVQFRAYDLPQFSRQDAKVMEWA